MNRFLISIAYLTLGTGLPLLAEKVEAAKQEPPKKEAPKKEASPQPGVTPPKAAAMPLTAPARARRPVRKIPAPLRNDYAKPHVDSSADRRPPVVWERNWVNSVRVEWEDAPVRKPPVVEAKETPNVAEELAAMRKTLEELTQLVRALSTPHQTSE